jgi:hypothetical protein
MSSSLGGGKSKSDQRSDPVTWQKMMTPWQKESMEKMAPAMHLSGAQGFAGEGITDKQRDTMKTTLMGSLSNMGGAQKMALAKRGAAQGSGMTGGVLEEARAGIGAGAMAGLGKGLMAIEDMNLQQANQKVANFLSWLTWHPPQSMKSEGKSRAWNAQTSAGLK